VDASKSPTLSLPPLAVQPHASGLGAPPLGDFFGNQAAATAALMASSSLGGLNPPPPPGPHTSRKSLDSALHAARAKAALDNPVIANARWAAGRGGGGGGGGCG
jgi:hypothetical protein